MVLTQATATRKSNQLAPRVWFDGQCRLCLQPTADFVQRRGKDGALKDGLICTGCAKSLSRRQRNSESKNRPVNPYAQAIAESPVDVPRDVDWHDRWGEE